MSTTGRKDDAGDPGSTGLWKHGFNLDCGLPGTLLLEKQSNGPWRILENMRATKNRLYIVRAAATKVEIHDVVDGKSPVPVAWIGHDAALARMLVERFNGYEMARDFPPKPDGEVGCAGETGCCAHPTRKMP